MRLYVWRSLSSDWVVTTTQKEEWLACLGRIVAHHPTHAEAFADAWARTHPKEAPDGR